MYLSVDVAAVRPHCCHIADEVFRGRSPGRQQSRSVSAADVVLYGVNLILPLMSQDLLKVREERNVTLKPCVLERQSSGYLGHKCMSDSVRAGT